MALRWIFWAVILTCVLPLAGAADDQPPPIEVKPRLKYKALQPWDYPGAKVVDHNGLVSHVVRLQTTDGIEQVWIDPQTNLRGDSQCAGALELPFMQGSAPRERSPCATVAGAVVDTVDTTVKKAKSWWERVFGR